MCILVSSMCSLTFASLVREQFSAFESSAEFEKQTLYTFIQDKSLLDSAKRVCSDDAIAKGERFGEKLNELLDERYWRMNDAEMLLDSLDLRNRVHAMHGRLSISSSDDDFCIRKILMYRLQKHLRKRHIELIDEKWLIDDFNMQRPPLREVALKKQILDTLLRNSSWLILPKLSTRVENPDFLESLSADERDLAERSRLLMERALAEVLASFVKKWRFTQQDIDRIADHIFLEYTADCTSVAGKYEVTYEVDKQGNKKNIRTTGLQLTVSTCTKIGFVLQKHLLSKLIVIHELWHHVWWYKDSTPERFTQLCRSADDTRTDRCTERDFVSEYAQIAPEEDYAEHFQQWVIQRRSRPWFIDTKLRYFDALFK